MINKPVLNESLFNFIAIRSFRVRKYTFKDCMYLLILNAIQQIITKQAIPKFLSYFKEGRMGNDETSCSADDAATLQEEAYSGKYPPFPAGRGEESSGAGADEGAEQEEA